MSPCPVCQHADVECYPSPDGAQYDCVNCGSYIIVRTAEKTLKDRFGNIGVARKRAVLSHAIRRMGRNRVTPNLSSEDVQRILAEDFLPTPAEQVNNFILALAEEALSKGYGHFEDIVYRDYRARVGAINAVDVKYIGSCVVDAGLFEEIDTSSSKGRSPEDLHYRPTLSGWDRYEELQKSWPHSRRAFMAMEYGDKDLDRLFLEHFKPAAKDAGFDLGRLDEDPQAGVLDVRMQVAIRTARFVVADLTHANNGVYWEAGFASGLGKPVIFTCREDVTRDIHFDTAHWLHVKWRAEEPEKAAALLRDCIRATLPTEAKMGAEERA